MHQDNPNCLAGRVGRQIMTKLQDSIAVGLLFFLILPTNIIGLWWAVGSPLHLDPNRICRRSRKLSKGGGSSKQNTICRKEPEIVHQVVKGTRLGIMECQYQMRYHRWNCTNVSNSFGKILKQDTRETAFANAITSAGATYALTQACSMGDLLQCGCAPAPSRNEPPPPVVTNSIPGTVPDNAWEWGGCGDDIEYGYMKSKEFMDTNVRTQRDINALITLHNNEAGRLAIKSHMRTECKCHGLSGSCTLQTCWKKMPQFREVGMRLKDKFKGAAKVSGGNNGDNILLPEDSTIKPPTDLDLVYSSDSPDLCFPNKKIGSLGTAGRRCNSTSMGVGGCDILCCGRGHQEEHLILKENCRCRFHWCCDVKCDTCTVYAIIHRCNGYS